MEREQSEVEQSERKGSEAKGGARAEGCCGRVEYKCAVEGRRLDGCARIRHCAVLYLRRLPCESTSMW